MRDDEALNEKKKKKDYTKVAMEEAENTEWDKKIGDTHIILAVLQVRFNSIFFLKYKVSYNWNHKI